MVVAVLALRALRPRRAGGTESVRRKQTIRSIRCAAERGATGRSATRSTTHWVGVLALRALRRWQFSRCENSARAERAA